MISPDPALLWYTKDFLTETQFLSFDDIGRLMKLRAAMHQHGPLTTDKVETAVGPLSDSLKELFEHTPDGKLYCPVVRDIGLKRAGFIANQKKKGRLGQKVKKTMKDKGLTKEQAREHLTLTDGIQFGKGRVKGSLSNNGNAIGDVNGNDNRSYTDQEFIDKIDSIQMKISAEVELTPDERLLMTKHGLNIPEKQHV